MDERQKYEQLIAGKLESLPVPDMQDLIWGRIKAQLDIDLPTDEGDGGSSPQKPSGPGIAGWGLSIILIAFVTAFFLLQNKPQTENTTESSTSTEQTIQPGEQGESPPGPVPNTNPRANAEAQQPVATPTDIVQDSSLSSQNLVTAMPGTPDTGVIKTPEPPITFTPTKTDTTQPARKGKGVRGLTDNDYRIVPKKDN